MRSSRHQSIKPMTRREWLEYRRHDVTSTESAALFGLSPYNTEFELYHQKIGELPDEIEENERMFWGNALEDAIARAFSAMYQVKVRRINNYKRDLDRRLGASYDYEIVGVLDGFTKNRRFKDMYLQFGPGNLEIKCVDYLIYRDQWFDGEEAPPHIEIQAQHQLAVDGRLWTCIAPLVAGNDMRPMIRHRDDKMIRGIRTAVDEFWKRVEAKTPPDPNFVRDADAIAKLYSSSAGKPLDAVDDAKINALCAEYDAARTSEKAGAERKKAAKAELLTLINDAPRVLADGYSISAREIDAKPGTQITKEMVGNFYGAKSGYRNFTLTVQKET